MTVLNLHVKILSLYRHFERSATCTDFTSVTQLRTRRLCEAKSVLINLSTSRCFGRDDDLFWVSVNGSELVLSVVEVKDLF